MYLHLGSDVMIPVTKIIGIFDLPVMEASSLSMPWADGMKNGKYTSFLLTDTGIFFSEISSITLKKRADNLFSQEYTDQ